MTQERLAEAVDLNPRTIQKIEAGVTNILVTTLVRIRRALRCPWDDLLGRWICCKVLSPLPWRTGDVL